MRTCRVKVKVDWLYGSRLLYHYKRRQIKLCEWQMRHCETTHLRVVFRYIIGCNSTSVPGFGALFGMLQIVGLNVSYISSASGSFVTQHETRDERDGNLQASSAHVSPCNVTLTHVFGRVQAAMRTIFQTNDKSIRSVVFITITHRLNAIQ